MFNNNEVISTPVEFRSAAIARRERSASKDSALAARAQDCARTLVPASGSTTSSYFSQRLKMLRRDLEMSLTSVPESLRVEDGDSQERLLADNAELLRSELTVLEEANNSLSQTIQVLSPKHRVMPRVLAIAQDLVAAIGYNFDESRFSAYLRSFQNITVLPFAELWLITPAIKLAFLERIARLALRKIRNDRSHEGEMASCIRSLRDMGLVLWSDLLDPLIVFDKVLCQDPAGAYAHMDAESRAMYRRTVVKLARYSDRSELEIAEMALSLARQSLRWREDDLRLARRRSHVGYYLIAEGRELLCERAGVRLPLRDRAQTFLHHHADVCYLTGITASTLCLILPLLWWAHLASPWIALIAATAFLIPCSQSAVEITNYLMTSLLEPQTLPKLDFADGVPDDCATMIVVPTLLLNEKQVRHLVKRLEVRYVANRGSNLHFALLTDLADSVEQPREDDPLVELCGQLIRELNRKYAAKSGTFSMFHRKRVYNPHEGVWMGWERKRGKLLDFNNLILGERDNFPYKVADSSVLSRIRFVLTLDSDTELPHGTARRLIGALAHPLNEPIIDNERNIVTCGYGILQPRVDISIESAAKSRFAAIYSGWAGLDIYTRAISDVYQDLYGEGTFVGKGLYEVRTFHRVLDRRFPSNTVLSHDLLEGAYMRTGLVSDTQVVDHYPSRYAAYARRKHRWVRGDWQILEWLFPRVPDESGKVVANPISVVSRWKIFDNLRRSVVEPIVFALFLCSWTFFPDKALYWTGAIFTVLLAPSALHVSAGLTRAAIHRSFRVAKQAITSNAAGLTGGLLNFIFLLHSALISTDAIFCSLYRRMISGRHLLEWETAAQAEAGTDMRTRLDLYLICAPLIALPIGAALFFLRPRAAWIALPLLILWASSRLVSLRLDRPARTFRKTTLRRDELLIRRVALRTWRYFAELSNEEQNWLIPDNFHEVTGHVANRISPTNLGFLLNARQAACELGYLTVPEFVRLTQRTFKTVERMYSYRGHLLAWYDTQTLSPLAPFFVSTVDSGNLAAALLTVRNGCEAMLEKPLLAASLLEGYDDHLLTLADLRGCSERAVEQGLRERENLSFIQRISAVMSDTTCSCDGGAEAAWFAGQLQTRRDALRNLIGDYMPWLFPESQAVLRNLGVDSICTSLKVPLGLLPGYIHELEKKLHDAAADKPGTDSARRSDCLLTQLTGAGARVERLTNDLRSIANDAGRRFDEMDFSFLLDTRRKILSIGYYLDSGKLHGACYDLLASEARMATFISLAKDDIPKDVWFRLGRAHVPTPCGPALASWSGSMFEYLMPAIWMESYKETLLQNSMHRAVEAQRAYAAEERIPWGISESGYCELADSGEYHYRAFGIPELAMQTEEDHRLVIAPYATVIALAVSPDAAIENLRTMARRGWFGKYGFYEAADFGLTEGYQRVKLVRSWMAHHQGMSLLSMANFLCSNVVRRWFHSDVHVQAAELLLQERMVLHHVTEAQHIKPPMPLLRTRAGRSKAA